MRPSIMEVHKIVSKDDHLVVIFNNSQIVAYFNENIELVNRFRIDHPRFLKDYKKKIDDAKKKKACYFYSYRSESTGLAVAALMVW